MEYSKVLLVLSLEKQYNKQTGYGVKLMDGGYYRFMASDCISFECLPEKSSQI